MKLVNGRLRCLAKGVVLCEIWGNTGSARWPRMQPCIGIVNEIGLAMVLPDEGGRLVFMLQDSSRTFFLIMRFLQRKLL